MKTPDLQSSLKFFMTTCFKKFKNIYVCMLVDRNRLKTYTSEFNNDYSVVRKIWMT